MKIVVFIMIVSAFFRFFNLNWGSPFYFHPDERNIASSIANINFPAQMNPHFFAYGSLPIYIIYFTAYFINFFLKSGDQFIQAIIVSRFYSAILSLALIPSIYFLTKRLADKNAGILAVLLCALSVGIIQFAHFGTFEIWITFFSIWLFYFSLNLINKSNLKNIFIVAIIFGILCAIKISSLPLLLIPIIAICINAINERKTILITYLKTFLMIFISILSFIIISPYILLDFNSFYSNIEYESSVALGTLPVFYTGEFFNTVPILYQFVKIYPFILNPFLTILFIPAFFYLIFKGIKTKSPNFLLLITCYLLLFISQAFLFAKWTRYIIPTLPFMIIIISVFFDNLLKKHVSGIKYLVLSIVITTSAIFSFSYFITAHIKPDTRISASIWAKENIPANSNILSEVYDMGIVPFNSYFSNITLFNFYDLDQTPNVKSEELNDLLSESEYIILPSPRIYKTRNLNKYKFPSGNNFYKNLFEEKLGYKKIYETPCDLFCKITYLGDPVFSLEQTANIFDRPSIFIFKNSNIKN